MTIWAYDLSRIKELQNQLAERSPPGRPSGRLPKVNGNIAILPIQGTITQRGDMFGTATQGLEAAFQRAVNSDRIGAIVLDIDSPGGTTSGVQMAADRIFAARGRKPIVAVANSLAASAAFWIGSAAETFVAAPGADVGSIGVFRMHEDMSGMMEQAGVNVSFIAVPEFKTEGNPFEPLTEEAREHNLEQVRTTFSEFNRAVARHRGVSPSVALDRFGKGRTFHSSEAAERGMVDRVGSIGRVMAELGVRGQQPRSEVAERLEKELCLKYLWGNSPEQSDRTALNEKRKRLDKLAGALSD